MGQLLFGNLLVLGASREDARFCASMLYTCWTDSAAIMSMFVVVVVVSLNCNTAAGVVVAVVVGNRLNMVSSSEGNHAS